MTSLVESQILFKSLIYVTSDALKIVPNTVVNITEVGTIFNASDVTLGFRFSNSELAFRKSDSFIDLFPYYTE